MRAVSYSFSLLALLLLVSLGAMAQVGTDGTILGAVTDANGGLVAGATVTVTNLDTGIQKVDTTRSDGNFEITSLPAGRYSVSVTFTGFKTWTLETTVLTISERKRVSPVLEVGQVNEKVTVEATAELIQTAERRHGWRDWNESDPGAAAERPGCDRVDLARPRRSLRRQDLHDFLRRRKQLECAGDGPPRRSDRI